MESVLLIEDDQRIRQAVAWALAERGYQVDTVGTGMAGLERTIQDSPNVVGSTLDSPMWTGGSCSA